MNPGIGLGTRRLSWPGATEPLLSFARWWLGEFNSLFESRIGRWLRGPQRKSVALEIIGDTVQITLIDGDRSIAGTAALKLAAYSETTLDGFLQTNKLSRRDVDISVRLPFVRFLCRQFLLPARAAGDVGMITANEISKKTPLKLDEIHHSFSIEAAPQPETLTVRQSIIKRSYVEAQLSALKLTAGEIAFVQPGNVPDGQTVPAISLHSAGNRERSWYWSSARMLAASAIVLGVIVTGVRFWQQQSILDELDAQIATTRAKAQRVRAEIDEIERRQAAIARLRTDKVALPGLLEIWEQVTVTLPSHSWLTELQLSQTGTDRPEQQLNLSGLSEAAASLVRVFDRSSLFQDASLTSPINVDPVEAKERFGIRMKLRGLNAQEPASR